MKILYFFFLVAILCSSAAFSQGLEGIIVERFYLTDAADETNASDNGAVVPLPAGSIVYRVYVDMADGYKFSQIFGTADHPLTVNGTADFYNDPSYGVAVNPATISANNIRKFTAMIDSWFAIGGLSNGKVGVLKIEDTDGSVGNQQGLLANNPGGCYGVPITGTGAQDGMTLNSPTTYVLPNALGIGSSLEALDQTQGNSVLIDNGAIASLGGVVGPTASNRVLLAQFTLDGELSFAFNVQLINAATGAAENYVASNPVAGELTHPTLTYNSNIAPTITITSPSNGSTIGFGNYTLTAYANDNQGYITAVEFFVDGVSVGTDAVAPYEAVYNATVGTHVITATATDADCLTGQAQAVNINVSSNQAPTITLNAPTIAVEGSPITLSSTAADADGMITQVEFFVDGVSVGVDMVAPYSVVWNATLGVDQSITAIATDNTGLSTTSNVIVITVNANIAPIVTITFPFSSSDFTAPETVTITADAVDIDGTVVSVEFFVNGISIGVDNSAPFSVNWISEAGPAEIVAVAIDSNGAETSSLSINLVVLDPTTEPYAIVSITQPCNIPNFCVPIAASAAFPVNNVIGYDIIMNYNPNDLQPTGSAELSSDMVDVNFAAATVNILAPGQVQITIALNGNAPLGTQFLGYGDLVCVGFSRLPGISSNDSTLVSVSSLVESYVTGPVTQEVNSAYIFSEPNAMYTGSLLTGATSIPLNSNESTAISGPITEVLGATGGVVNVMSTSAEIDANGSFMYDLTNGLELSFDRDIDNASSVQATINGADILIAKALLSGNYTPSIWEILAMDVNLDGAVTAGDISQMNQRSTRMINEYQQAWNTAGQPSKDWIFIDETLLNTAAFNISASFPLDDQLGFSASRVPSVPFTLPTEASNFNPSGEICQEWNTGHFKAVLLGDVNASYGVNSTNNQDSVLFDLSEAVFTTEGATNYIEVPVKAHVVNNDVRAIDAALKYNQNKLSYNSMVSVDADMEVSSYFAADDAYLRLTATRNTTVALSDYTVIAHIKFEILDNCAAVFSTDFNSISTWINGAESGYRILDGSTLPEPIQVISSAPYCSGVPVQFGYVDMIDGSMINSYSWQFSDGSTANGQYVSVPISSVGAVSVTLNLTAANGCSYQIPTEVFVSTSPVASFTYTFDPNTSLVTFNNTSTIGAGSIDASSWSFGDNSTSSEINPTHTYAASGLYSVSLTVTSASGCTSDFTQQVNASVGVEEMLSDNVIRIYPNPTVEEAFILSSEEGMFMVTDASGRVLINQTRITPNGPLSMDTSNWAEGMYQVLMISSKGVRTTRLVKFN